MASYAWCAFDASPKKPAYEVYGNRRHDTNSTHPALTEQHGNCKDQADQVRNSLGFDNFEMSCSLNNSSNKAVKNSNLNEKTNGSMHRNEPRNYELFSN